MQCYTGRRVERDNYNDAKEGKWNVLKAGLPVRQTIINPVPGVSTERGAAEWVPILESIILPNFCE